MTSARRIAAAAGRLRRHPLVTVAAAAVLVGVHNARWTSRHRSPAALDVDEAGYAATALRLGRNFPVARLDGSFCIPSGQPLGFLKLIGETRTGPLVPALSTPVVVVGDSTLTSAHLVQPALHGLAAIGAAGVAGALGGPGASVTAGLTTLGLPGAVNAARYHGFALGASAGLGLATWSMLRLGGGRHHHARAVAAGAALGAMTLTRTMTVAFVPGLVAAGWLRSRPCRIDRGDVLAGAAAALVVAGPWWARRWGPATTYLLRYGYGDLSGEYGPSELRDRVVARVVEVAADVRLPMALPAAGALVGAAAGAAAAVRRAGVPSDRDLVAVAVVLGAGTAALLSTPTTGPGFELPLEVLAVAALAGAAGRLPVPVSKTLGVTAVLVAAANVALVGRSTFGRERLVVWGRYHLHLSDLLFGGLEHVQRERVMVEPRLDPRSGVVSIAEEEWWAAVESVVDVLAAQDAGRNKVVHTVVGSAPMLSMNSLVLCQELRRTALGGVSAIDTTASEEDQLRQLGPMAGEVPRLVVVILTSGQPYPSHRNPEDVLVLALRHGWSPLAEVPLPDGGRVVILHHRDHPETGGVGPLGA